MSMFEIKKYTLLDNMTSAVIGMIIGSLICTIRQLSIQQPQEIVVQPVVNIIEVCEPSPIEHYILEPIEEEIFVEDFVDQDAELARIMEEKMLLVQLVHAEAGNQDLIGKRLVVDVVMNRVNDDRFPNTIEEVIFQDNQFSVIENGAFDKAENELLESDWEAVDLEYDAERRIDYGIVFFSRAKSKYGTNHFRHGDHWFGY